MLNLSRTKKTRMELVLRPFGSVTSGVDSILSIKDARGRVLPDEGGAQLSVLTLRHCRVPLRGKLRILPRRRWDAGVPCKQAMTSAPASLKAWVRTR
jgi:hypothetical protein